MRTIEETTRFRRDYKGEKRGVHRSYLDRMVESTVDMLARDIPLPRRFFDHPLAGDWQDFRDCHLRGDLVLIYRKIGDHTLQLVRVGSHSELGI
jgi:mRNA interferase YafQ